jgi:hypothetical protein
MRREAARRFIEMPAILSPLENGDVAAFANVDASSSFMGMTYANRAGIWALPIARGSLQGVEEGLIYYGTRARPALRFTYRDAVSNKSRTAILSVPTPAACRIVLADLAAAGGRLTRIRSGPVDSTYPAGVITTLR